MGFLPLKSCGTALLWSVSKGRSTLILTHLMKVETEDIQTLFHSFLSLPILSSHFQGLQQFLIQDGSNVHGSSPSN